MDCIVLVDQNWGIGKDDNLLINLSLDMSRFVCLTSGKTIIYGHTTLKTFPSQKPLKNRRNIILSRDPSLNISNAEIWNQVDQTLYNIEDSFCIGGESVYRQLLPYCKNVFVTYVDMDLGANKYFPNLDNSPKDWKLVATSPKYQEWNVEFQFLQYAKKGQ